MKFRVKGDSIDKGGSNAESPAPPLNSSLLQSILGISQGSFYNRAVSSDKVHSNMRHAQNAQI